MKELVVFLLLSSFDVLTNSAQQNISKVYTHIDTFNRPGTSADMTIPQARWAHQMTYDEEKNRILLFGGSHGNTILADLWTWDGSKWKEVIAEGSPAINKGVFVYDANRKTNV